MIMRASADETQLFDNAGQRKYLNTKEARRLLTEARRVDPQTRLFCQLLYHTGCRVSEALAVTPRLLDQGAGCVVFRTLKRRKLVHRSVPISSALMRELLKMAEKLELGERLFPWTRQTGWRRIKALMLAAGISGPQATPKGLRHQYGCRGVSRQVPESTVGKWLGHANDKSTRIYTAVVGDEERALARRMWGQR